ncbi:hypothetical protein TTHERM_00035590 (macronuclear) [Tetrahymena thermophila SB210]|uniref:Uncharacterized protein n=1 Tax=Tetrahymena thermophila (strain SB210) TaxID=312017 RepID=Q22MG1_TETTS|nr:hypothetical protein TTHERM_00035590 [Tetrahymena thermophila SB210]EAR86277.3 hypothetical protein TTHERM_00035590 [Tetrahymena thermophila SB210]|eukprot:XP_977059.3 hypothetical protein TTHERM_00035590 [Tetrahymena thermophila SB210]
MSQSPLQKQENKPKSILEDSLKVIQERAKKQHGAVDKQQDNDSQQILETSVEQKKQFPTDDNPLKNAQLDINSLQLRANVIQSTNQNTNQSTNLSSQKSQNQYQIEQAGDIQSKSLLDSQNEFTKQNQQSDGLQKIILTSPLSYQKKNESNRYIQEIQLNNHDNNINQDKNKSFDFNMPKNHPQIEIKQYEQYIGVQSLDNQDFKEKRLISPIINDQKSNSNQSKTQNEFDVISNQNSNQYILTPMQENNFRNNDTEQIKQCSSRFLTPVKTDQNKCKLQQKYSQKEKVTKQINAIRQNQSLSAAEINQSSPNQEENKTSSKKINHQHFRMDGNYYQSNSPEDMSQHSKNQFVIRKQSSRLSGQIIERKKIGEEQDLQNQKRSIDYNNRNNQRSNSGKKQIFTKSYYDDESHKKFIIQKIKERKQLQMKREKQFLEQQEHLKKQEIEELEEQNKKKEQAIQQRAIIIQERMKKSKQYRESLEANKSSSREKSPIFEHRQKPLYKELQEKFQQNQQQEIEERKKILEAQKAKKQNYKIEDIIKHQKELSQQLNERQNSQQKKSQQLDWHYEKPKYQSKLWEICEQEKNESYKKEQEKQIMRRLREERRHKFGQQIREDNSQNKNQIKQNQNNDSQNENMDNDTIDDHFLSQSKYYQRNSPHQMEAEGNLIEIKDEKINKSQQKNKKYQNHSYINKHQQSVNSFNENSINTIEFNQEHQNQKYTENQVLNKISSSQHNLYHLSNRFRGNKLIQRQYTADQLLISHDMGKEKNENLNQNKQNKNINFMKQDQKNESQFEKNNFLNQYSVQNFPNVSKNFSREFYPDLKQKNHPKKIYSAKERLNSVISSNQSFNNHRNYSKNRSEKTNDSKSTSEIYQDLIQLHDQNLTQKLNNKSKSVHERVEDVKVETKKMEQIANKQQKLLKVSSNEEIDRVFISEIYIKSIKAKLAVLDEIVPFYNQNNINNNNHSKSQQQDIQKQENINQNINQNSQIVNKEQQDSYMQTQFSQNHSNSNKKTLRFVDTLQIQQQDNQ